MGIAYVDQPFRAVSKTSNVELLVIAFIEHQQTSLSALCIDEEGNLVQLNIENINMSWRFDNRKQKWIDAFLPEEPDEED